MEYLKIGPMIGYLLDLASVGYIANTFAMIGHVVFVMPNVSLSQLTMPNPFCLGL